MSWLLSKRTVPAIAASFLEPALCVAVTLRATERESRVGCSTLAGGLTSCTIDRSTCMKLGLLLKSSDPKGVDMDLVLEAESLGYESVWTGESYGSDVVTPITWVLARTTRIKAGTGIMQMSARTPSCAAMTAMSLQQLSGNRFLCGIGPSGPPVLA